jgi:hypothetical protein
LQFNFPPCFSSIICLAIANPNPVPLPTPLVVNEWSNILVFTSSFIPFPLSAIEILTWLFSIEVLIVIWLKLVFISAKLRK